ncbi:MAG: hypothetical protein U0521_29745 [Anaerolineae bacterium]
MSTPTTRCTEWERVYAPGRRRRMHFDGEHRLAVFVSSRSDIDDLIPILTAYQIEWNKLNALLQSEVARLFLMQYQDRRTPLSESELAMLAASLRLDSADLRRIEVVGRALRQHAVRHVVGASHLNSPDRRVAGGLSPRDFPLVG